MRIPELEKKIGCPLGWVTGDRPGNGIELRNIGQILHAVGGPRVKVCADKLDTRRNRVWVRLVNDGRPDRKDVMRGAVHVDIREDRASRYSAACALTK